MIHVLDIFTRIGWKIRKRSLSIDVEYIFKFLLTIHE